jgi:hypothetical protein
MTVALRNLFRFLRQRGDITMQFRQPPVGVSPVCRSLYPHGRLSAS